MGVAEQNLTGNKHPGGTKKEAFLASSMVIVVSAPTKAGQDSGITLCSAA